MLLASLVCWGASCAEIQRALAPACYGQTVGESTNIVLLLADDLAWSDLGCYGHPWHETPNLDSLAKHGMRFTDAYAPAPICSASRASILTGKTPARLHFEFVTKQEPGRQRIEPAQPLHAPPFTLNLPLAEITLAEILNRADYDTAFFGKWHVNAHYERYLGWSPTHGPVAQGFRTAVEDFGSHPYAYRGNPDARPPAIDVPGEIPADSLTERAVGFLKSARGRPCFLMLSHFFVHTPVETPCRWMIDKYEREIPIESPNREQRLRYAAFVETLDHHVGRLLAALDDAGLRNNTLVVFTSDNGGHPEYAGNRPLRGSKWNLYEGGIRVPFLVRWPGRVPAESVCGTPVIGYDLLPTFAEVAGVSAQIASITLDGRSLLPLFQSPDAELDRDLYWHFPYYHPEGVLFGRSLPEIGIDDFAVSQTRPQSAVRRGRYKGLYFYESDILEVYDLETDPGEQRDLRKASPELASGLRRSLTSALEHAQARYPNTSREDE
jgi:uncharacterized sulfatase